ncbi:MAG: hypothetical protein NTV22_11050 [bacterium]|nr:hypothetical protein [bacterium]
MTITAHLPVPATRIRRDHAALARLLEERNVKYGRWTYSAELAPAILTRADRARLQHAAEAIVRASELVTDIVVAQPQWHAHYAFPREFWELVLMDSGYGMNIPCARFDAVMNGDAVTFIELNTDGCSGMSNVDALHASFMDVFGAQPAYGLQAMHYDRAVPHVLDTLLLCYERFRATHAAAALPAQPAIAILDLPGEATHWEFSAIASACHARGLAAHVVTPAQAAFDGRTLCFDGQPVQLIYRRMLGGDYAEHLNELQPVTAAFRARRVCMVGAPRSQIAFSKRLFALLHDAAIQAALPAELVQAVRQHVPWTAPLQPQHALFRGASIDLLPFVRAHRDLFVIKPCVSKLGFGIHQGRFMTDAAWQHALDAALPHDFIVQEFVDLPTALFPEPDKPATTTTRYVHLGPYVFGGVFCGTLGRTCDNPLLSLHTGERLLPVLYTQST